MFHSFLNVFIYMKKALTVVGTISLLCVPLITNAALIDDVNSIFRLAHDRTPTYTEWEYWASRVVNGDKTTADALYGAIQFHKIKTTGSITTTSTVLPASDFKIDTKYYPSPVNPNFLPDGTLVKAKNKPQIYYLRNGKKSWIMDSIVSQWLSEAHYFDRDVIISISETDLDRYPQVTSVNPYYVGKILRHPDGRQFFIDDQLRKRPLSSSVRSALNYPSRNLYPTSAGHLSEFKTGSAITRTDIHPGGTVTYNGAYHGGTVWRIEENDSGKLTKRLYLQDYIYEAEGYPWSSQILPVSDAELERYARGSNIERYPNGWVVGVNNKTSVVRDGKLRHITALELFDAMGYSHKYVLDVYPEFLERYPQTTPIAAFKTLKFGTSSGSGSSTEDEYDDYASTLVELRPSARDLIRNVNDTYLSVFDKQITADANKFWVDYVYKGEAQSKRELIVAMEETRDTGTRPSFTPRKTAIDEDLLKNRWFSYLFYYVWHEEPSQAAQDYWHSRIGPSDIRTIYKLGGAIQWLKDTQNKTHQ